MIGAAAAFYDSLAERYHLRGLGPDGSLADLRAELAEILREAGFRDVDWLMPETSGYYQLVFTARRG